MRANDDQMLAIDEFMHPRVQEIAETLPAPLGPLRLDPGWVRGLIERLTRKGRVVTTSSLGGFLLLYTVAGMKRWRRSTLRYAAENAAIEDWLARHRRRRGVNPSSPSKVAAASAWSRATATRTSAACAISRR